MATAATTNGTTTTTHTNGTTNGTTPPKIHLYTNHSCPYAHRAHIALSELKLPFEETIIDLNTPRPQWYLDINPRGLVPSMKYSVPGILDKEETIYESAIVSQFLADSFPSPLLPSTREDPLAPLRRARINFFTDTWNSKISSFQMTIMKAGEGEKEKQAEEWVAAIEKEIEPLLADAAPFFGGSKELTFAEVIVAPFLLRWYAFAKHGEVVPASFAEKLDSLPHFGPWAKAVCGHKSVLGIWDAEGFVEAFLAKRGDMVVRVKK